MAITKAVEQKVEATQTTVTAPAVQEKAGNGIRTSKHDAFKAKGEALREKMTTEQKALEGSKSDKIKFISCLGNPDKPQPRRDKKQDIPSVLVVGYRFKALEDVVVPKANLKEGFKSLMDVEDMVDVQIKAGQEFDLNIFEAGVLISRPEYAGKFTGEGESVSLTLKFSESRPDPLPVLNKDTAGSIKISMIHVADMIADPANPKGKGIPKVKEEFAEKFGVLFTKKSAGKKSTSAGKKSGEVQKDLAAAFSAYIKGKN